MVAFIFSYIFEANEAVARDFFSDNEVPTAHSFSSVGFFLPKCEWRLLYVRYRFIRSAGGGNGSDYMFGEIYGGNGSNQSASQSVSLIIIYTFKYAYENVAMDDVNGFQYSHRILKDMEQVAKEAEGDFYDHYSNPLNAYKIISRFVIDWQNLNKTVFEEQPARG